MFQVAGTVYLVGAATYLLWGQVAGLSKGRTTPHGQAELQKWAEVGGKEEEEEEEVECGTQLIKEHPGLPSFKAVDC